MMGCAVCADSDFLLLYSLAVGLNYYIAAPHPTPLYVMLRSIITYRVSRRVKTTDQPPFLLLLLLSLSSFLLLCRKFPSIQFDGIWRN